ncbi:unnamed protein product, partial [Choristocarpus tenellus]
MIGHPLYVPHCARKRLLVLAELIHRQMRLEEENNKTVIDV